VKIDRAEHLEIDFRFKVLGSINRKSSTFVRTFALSSLSSTFIKLKAPNLYNFSKFCEGAREKMLGCHPHCHKNVILP